MLEKDGREASIMTPEHVRLRFETAGLGSRAGAQLIDVLIIGLIMALFIAVVSLTMSALQIGIENTLADFSLALIILFTFALISGYFIVTEYFFAGQTPGKKVMGLRTLQNDGRPPTFLSALIRNVFRLLDFLPFFYLLGAVWMFFHPQDKRIGDIAAGTIVIRDARIKQMRLRNKAKKWIERKMGTLPQVRWPDGVSNELARDEWQLVSAFAERLPTLDPYKRDELAAHIIQILAARRGLESRQLTPYPAAFLAALYVQLADEWPV